MNPKPRSLLMKISEGLPYLEKSFSTSSSEVPAGRLPTNSRLRCVYVFSPGFLKLVRSMVRPASGKQHRRFRMEGYLSHNDKDMQRKHPARVLTGAGLLPAVRVLPVAVGAWMLPVVLQVGLLPHGPVVVLIGTSSSVSLHLRRNSTGPCFILYKHTQKTYNHDSRSRDHVPTYTFTPI